MKYRHALLFLKLISFLLRLLCGSSDRSIKRNKFELIRCTRTILSVNKRHATHAEEMAFFYELAANEQILSCPTVR